MPDPTPLALTEDEQDQIIAAGGSVSNIMGALSGAGQAVNDSVVAELKILAAWIKTHRG